MPIAVSNYCVSNKNNSDIPCSTQNALWKQHTEKSIFLELQNELESQGAMRDRKAVVRLSIAVQSNHHF